MIALPSVPALSRARLLGLALGGIALLPSVVAQVAEDWPGFRGPGGVGHAVGANPPTSWSGKENTNILWKTAVARHGMSSPILSKKRLFLTAADDSVRQILCHDADTGELLWHHDVEGIPDVPEQALPHVLEETGFAAPTPVTDGRFVAAVFATGELVCVNVNGARVWARHLGVPTNHYGHASSLIRADDLLIVQYDKKEDSSLLAFDLATGTPAWQAKRNSISWSSPIVVDNRGRMEVILTDSKAVQGYDPKTGESLWRVECLAGEVAPSAAYAEGVVFVASEGATGAAIDISRHVAQPKLLWQWDESLPDAASPVANKDFLLVPTAFGTVTCLDAKSGAVLWEHEFSKGFNSSPILVNDLVYVVDVGGTTQIFKLGRKFEQVGNAEIGEPVYATPAFVGGRIFIRGLNHLFCIEERR